MKSTVSNQPCDSNLPYPKLMYLKSNVGLIVLFSKQGCGTVVSTKESCWEIGEYSEDWSKTNFVDFNGSVCLENDK